MKSSENSRTMFASGSKVYFRALEKEDALGKYYKWFNDQEVCQYNSHGCFPYTIPDLVEYISSNSISRDRLVLGIFTTDDSSHIGNISLQQIDWISRNAEYAIIIGEKNYWKGGYGKEASDLLLYHGFIRLNLFRIYCGTAEDNIGMQKLARYMGMSQEGVRRKAMYKNGQYKDVIEFGILREEYLATSNYQNIMKS